MNRHLFLSLLLALFASSTLSADNLKIEPAFWWSGMKNPELQLMVYGKDIAGYLPSVKYPGVQLKSSVAKPKTHFSLLAAFICTKSTISRATAFTASSAVS